jgi:hypothetical protein
MPGTRPPSRRPPLSIASCWPRKVLPHTSHRYCATRAAAACVLACCEVHITPQLQWCSPASKRDPPPCCAVQVAHHIQYRFPVCSTRHCRVGRQCSNRHCDVRSCALRQMQQIANGGLIPLFASHWLPHLCGPANVSGVTNVAFCTGSSLPKF